MLLLLAATSGGVLSARKVAPSAFSCAPDSPNSFAVVCDAEGEENYLLPRCRDTDDQKFLILAARCRADLLLTRDKLLLRLNRHRHIAPPCPILTAEDAHQRLFPTASP